MPLVEGFNSIRNVGVSPSSRPYEVVQKRTFNSILLLIFTFLTFSLLTNVIQKSWIMYDTILYGGVTTILIITFILLSRNFYKTAVLFFLSCLVLIMFILSLLDQNSFQSSLSTVVAVMVSIAVLRSEKLQGIIAVLLFVQQVLIYHLLGTSYTIGSTQYHAVDIDFPPVVRSIVYACYYWFFFSVTFHLKRQVINTAIQLNLKKDEIQASYLRIEEFAHIISHDLKSPLRNMTNFAGLISKKLEANQLDKVKEYSSVIENSGTKALNLIDGVLQYSKLNNATIDQLTTFVDLDVVIKDIEKDLLPLYPRANLRYGQLGGLSGNYSKVKTLFQNLIENGLKYNRNRSPTIHIQRQKTIDSDTIVIEDNGIGIEKEHFKTIFEPFKRLHNDSEYAGSGIGLASCKTIVDDHLQGDLDVLSEIGKGSKFSISLPLS